jgi:hypothetical protein
MKTLSTFVVMSLSLLTACDGGGASATSLAQTASPLAAPGNVSGATCNPTSSPFGGGTGSSASPYLICTPAQLLEVSDFTTSNFLLSADIDVSHEAQADALLVGMDGMFDGGNHTVSGLRNNSTSATYVGLFSENSGTVQNLILSGVAMVGVSNVGTVAGQNTGLISNVQISGGVQTLNYGGSNIGGVVGINKGGTIRNVTTNVVVTGSNSVGGIAGSFTGGVIASVTVGGSVSGSFDIGGGFGSNDIRISTGGTGTGSIGATVIHATYNGNNSIGCMNGYEAPESLTTAGNSC